MTQLLKKFIFLFVGCLLHTSIFAGDISDVVGKKYYVVDPSFTCFTNSVPPTQKSGYSDSLHISSPTEITLLGNPCNDALEVVPFDPNLFVFSNDLSTLHYNGKIFTREALN